jgi:dihydropteroate synthase
MKLRARQFSFEFPGPALVMGIVNVTPDSFSDGGKFFDARAAVAHGMSLVDQGAAILDIGGESSRPGAEPVEEKEELRRVLPVVEELAARTRVPISIDTTKLAVAQAALRAGASIVNDIGADREDRALWDLVAESGAGYVCMHRKGTPPTMQNNPRYDDVVAEVNSFFLERLTRLHDCRVAADQIILDPGIGFGKGLEHNLQLLGGLREFATLGRPLLVGVSRKSFIGKLLGGEIAARLPGALACAAHCVAAGARIIRAHDVAETLGAVRMTEAIMARQKVECGTS